MAMEPPCRHARHSKGGARLARLRLGRPRHPRLPNSHPPPSPPLRSAGSFESDLEFERPRGKAAPHPESGDGRHQLALPDGRRRRPRPMRTTWPLKPEDQKVFDFDFVSNKVFEGCSR